MSENFEKKESFEKRKEEENERVEKMRDGNRDEMKEKEEKI